MIFKILLFRSGQTPNSDKNWQTSCPLQTFVCNISRHLEFIIEQGHRVNWVAGSPGRWIPGSPGRRVTKCDPVPCLVWIFVRCHGVDSYATAAHPRRVSERRDESSRCCIGRDHWCQPRRGCREHTLNILLGGTSTGISPSIITYFRI